MSSSSSDGAWELPQEFRQMQQTARRFMRERVVPAEAPLPHDAYALPDDVLKALQEEAKKLGFWNVESPAEWGGIWFSHQKPVASPAQVRMAPAIQRIRFGAE